MDFCIVCHSKMSVPGSCLYYELIREYEQYRSFFTISIKSTDISGEKFARVCDFTDNFDMAVDIFCKISLGEVRPYHLNDIIYNIICEGELSGSINTVHINL